jgi:tetratricopeptide (TPR) repeat protein
VADLHRRYAGSLDALTEYDASIAQYQRALELVRHIGDRAREAAILAEMSAALGRDHRAEEAVQFNEQSMAAARDLGDHRLEAVCLNQRARLRAVWHAEVGPAMADAEAALRLAASVGDTHGCMPTSPRPWARFCSGVGSTQRRSASCANAPDWGRRSATRVSSRGRATSGSPPVRPGANTRRHSPGIGD